jgi:hypothetical protein
VNINLHLTDTTQLHAEGYVLDGRLFAEIRWGLPNPARLGDGALWGTPTAMRHLAELAVQAAIQAEGGSRLASPYRCHGRQARTGRMSALLHAALGYAARGIPVYPVHWPRPTPGGATLGCSCPRGPACDRPAKHPLVRHGTRDATTEPGQLECWWQRWPQAGVGLASGVVFDALDVDGPAGLVALRQFARTVALRLPGPLVRTGGGGWHYWFRPTALGNRPPHDLAHVDWRGRGGCVLAPPSRHISGRTYRWLRTLYQAPLPEVPAALRALLDPDPPATARPARTVGPAALGHPYGRTVLAAELAALHRATPGHRNHTLNRCAFKVYRYVASGILDDDEVSTAFTQAALAIGLEAAEVARTLASARTAGLANPRSLPTVLPTEAAP